MYIIFGERKVQSRNRTWYIWFQSTVDVTLGNHVRPGKEIYILGEHRVSPVLVINDVGADKLDN